MGYSLHTLDIRTAYLNAKIEPEISIWMKQPRGYEQVGPNGEEMCCKMIKALYGLKQGGRRWEATLRNTLVEMGFKCSSSDPGMFELTKGTKKTHPTCLRG